MSNLFSMAHVIWFAAGVLFVMFVLPVLLRMFGKKA